MKSLNEMDLEEWEILPDEGFLEINDDGGNNKIYSRKASSNTTLFQTNYFICPPPSEFVDKTILPVPIDLQATSLKPQDQEEELLIKKEAVEIKMTMPPAAGEKIKSFSTGGLPLGSDQDPAVSQVFFKKMKETEFADMKMDSPKSSSGRGGGIMPQIEGAFHQFDQGNGDQTEVDDSEMVINTNKNMDLGLEASDDEGGFFNIWKWSLTGIGAICSFGVAAATICIISFGKNKHPQQNQKLQFQIYTNDKRIKQVVHHANKLNEAISAVRGVPITRAHITFGGYYDASP